LAQQAGQAGQSGRSSARRGLPAPAAWRWLPDLAGTGPGWAAAGQRAAVAAACLAVGLLAGDARGGAAALLGALVLALVVVPLPGERLARHLAGLGVAVTVAAALAMALAGTAWVPLALGLVGLGAGIASGLGLAAANGALVALAAVVFWTGTPVPGDVLFWHVACVAGGAAAQGTCMVASAPGDAATMARETLRAHVEGLRSWAATPGGPGPAARRTHALAATRARLAESGLAPEPRARAEEVLDALEGLRAELARSRAGSGADAAEPELAAVLTALATRLGAFGSRAKGPAPDVGGIPDPALRAACEPLASAVVALRAPTADASAPPQAAAAPPVREVRLPALLAAEPVSYALRLALVMVAAERTATLFGLPHPGWAALVAALVLRPEPAPTALRGAGRALAVALGAAGTLALLQLPGAAPWAAAVVLLVAVAGVVRLDTVTQVGVAACLSAAMIALETVASGPATRPTATGIAAATAIGSALALLAHARWPRERGTSLRERTVRAVRAQRGWAEATLRLLAMPEPVAAAGVEALGRHARRALAELRSEADAAFAGGRDTPADPRGLLGLLRALEHVARATAALQPARRPGRVQAVESAAAPAVAIAVGLRLGRAAHRIEHGVPADAALPSEHAGAPATPATGLARLVAASDQVLEAAGALRALD